MSNRIHIQAPDATSALSLRHRLNALGIAADMMPAGDEWEVLTAAEGFELEDVVGVVEDWIEQQEIPATLVRTGDEVVVLERTASALGRA